VSGTDAEAMSGGLALLVPMAAGLASDCSVAFCIVTDSRGGDRVSSKLLVHYIVVCAKSAGTRSSWPGSLFPVLVRPGFTRSCSPATTAGGGSPPILYAPRCRFQSVVWVHRGRSCWRRAGSTRPGSPSSVKTVEASRPKISAQANPRRSDRWRWQGDSMATPAVRRMGRSRTTQLSTIASFRLQAPAQRQVDEVHDD